MTFEEFIATVDFKFNDGIYKNKLRYGQSIMNELWVVDPEKYKEITQTDHDCFYNDSIVPLTLEKLKKEWKLS